MGMTTIFKKYLCNWKDNFKPCKINDRVFTPWEHIDEDWNYYSKSWHSQHGPRRTYERGVTMSQYVPGQGIVKKNLNIEGWRGEWMLNAISKLTGWDVKRISNPEVFTTAEGTVIDMSYAEEIKKTQKILIIPDEQKIRQEIITNLKKKMDENNGGSDTPLPPAPARHPQMLIR